MRIKRVQVEEGFLDGLDVSFAPGLNVVIGERGTGKTSLIELIRFCLGVQGYTAKSTTRSIAHAVSVLGSGQVTLTLTDGERDTIVSRTTSDEFPRTTAPYPHPLIFSQTEIESVGLQEQGRLRLLDSFSDGQQQAEHLDSEAASEIRSLTAQTDALRREIDTIEAQVEAIPTIDDQIAALVPQEKELDDVLADAKDKKSRLDTISANIAASAVGLAAIERFLASVSDWAASLSSLASSPPILEPWPDGAGLDLLLQSRPMVELARDYLNDALTELQRVASDAEQSRLSTQDKKLELEDRARQLRKDVDSLQAGAGAIFRRGQQLRERKAELQALNTVLSHRQATLESLLGQRSSALDRLDSIREQRFRARNTIAMRLSEALGPRIRVKVARAGQFEAYAAAIADSLRGSGLRYNDLSSAVAAHVSPRELLEAADTNNFELLSETTGITKDRALRALSHLRQADLGALATVSVEDTVTLQLLDGANYKSISELSTGQRCTVVLPLVLSHTDRVLIVDQPEDHIDNAFIADTLIRSIQGRTPDSQSVFTTHNANIPVLGNADRVIQLGSDGRRGFPVLASRLYDPEVVTAITSVMEGGAEAFQKRVTFYSRHLPS